MPEWALINPLWFGSRAKIPPVTAWTRMPSDMVPTMAEMALTAPGLGCSTAADAVGDMILLRLAVVRCGTLQVRRRPTPSGLDHPTGRISSRGVEPLL